MVSILVCSLSAQTDEKKKPLFDPNSLNDPEPSWPKVMHPLLPLEDIEMTTDLGENSDQLINGYRVQVMATRYYEKADSLRNVLTEQFGSEVYIDFEAPNYKVRVGNCIVRKDAEILQAKLKSIRYESAWIIRTRVYTQY